MSLRPRFRLGPLLWTIALIAIVLGWWIDRHRLVTQMRDYALERDQLLEQNHRLADALRAGK